MTDKITKEDKILMDSITDLLNDYIASKKSPLLILNDIAKVFTVLYKYNNIGSCKKVIKTLTTERNSFCRFFESQGLLIKWNVKTDDMQIWKNESYTGDLNESFSDWIKNEREESKEAKKKVVDYDDSQVRHLDALEHIRLRSGMYIGRLGDGSNQNDGIYVLTKEVIDNSIDEFNQGCGKIIEITMMMIM